MGGITFLSGGLDRYIGKYSKAREGEGAQRGWGESPRAFPRGKGKVLDWRGGGLITEEGWYWTTSMFQGNGESVKKTALNAWRTCCRGGNALWKVALQQRNRRPLHRRRESTQKVSWGGVPDRTHYRKKGDVLPGGEHRFPKQQGPATVCNRGKERVGRCGVPAADGFSGWQTVLERKSAHQKNAGVAGDYVQNRSLEHLLGGCFNEKGGGKGVRTRHFLIWGNRVYPCGKLPKTNITLGGEPRLGRDFRKVSGEREEDWDFRRLSTWKRKCIALLSGDLSKEEHPGKGARDTRGLLPPVTCHQEQGNGFLLPPKLGMR